MIRSIFSKGLLFFMFLLSFPAASHGASAPDIAVSPAGLDFNLMKGTVSSGILTITNSGEGDLTFSITTEEASGSSAQSGTVSTAEGYNAMLSADASGKRKYKIPRGPEYSRKHLLVKFKEGTTDLDKGRVHGKVRASVKRRYKGIKLDKVEVADGKIEEAINEYLKDGNVEYAEPDYMVKALTMPDDPGFSQLWGLHNTGQSGGKSDADIDAPEAWDISTGGAVVVAVIDTGVDYNHEDLAANIWVNTQETPGNGIDDDGNGYIDDYRGWDFINDDNDPMDDNGHGSHCSGTIAGRGNNGVGVTGVNWTAKIMPLKFLGANGYGSTSDVVEAVLYSKNMGARVSSNSWGGGGYSQALVDAINSFGQSGGLFVAAAGNDASDTDSNPHYPSSFELPNIISVAATDRNDALAWFSNYGAASVDLAAPGVSVYSSVPGGYATYSGTSMATPHVSGVAALLLSRYPGMSATALKDIIMDSTDPVAALAGKMATGGRLNARKALEATGVFWLSLSGTSGLISPGSSEDITVTADSSALSGGTYNVNIVISSNDPDENPLTVPVSLTVTADEDGDGYLSGTDCDDLDALEHPDQTWYRDSDGDGYSDGDMVTQCLRFPGYYAPEELIQTSGDCNDSDPLEHPGQTWYQDADGDGYSSGVNAMSCARPAGYKTASELTASYGDCDDSNSSVTPAEWYADSDGDGFGNASVFILQCTQPDGYVSDNTDCNDSDAAINPAAHETAYNGADDDCNPVTSDHPWYDFTIDTSANGISHTSMAADSGGRAHISYFESVSGDLKYATNVSGTWVAITIDSAGIAGENNSIAVDHNDKVHISYRFYGSGNGLKYATNASGAWTVSTIYASEPVESTSLVVDSGNKIHISFETPNSDALMYATNISGPWVISIIDYPVSSPSIYNSMAIDSNDKLHVTYISNGIRYATNQSGSWVISTIPDPYSSTYDSSIAVDSNNKVHISYRDQSGNGYLKYATNSSGSWVISSLDSGSGTGCSSSIKTDSADKVHISYYICHTSYFDLKYATNQSGEWVVSVLDSPGDVGDDSSLAIDSSNNIHISYVDRTNRSLKYIVKHMMDEDNDADGFTENQGDCDDYSFFTNPAAQEVCDGADNNCDLQIDEGLAANIFYWDADHDGYGNPLISVQACIPPAGYVPDIDCNDGNPAISPGQTEIPDNCADDDCDPATYDFSQNGSWTTECVNDLIYTIWGTSIAADPNGKAHISYYDFDDDGLKYVSNASGLWDEYTVASTGYVNSMKTDRNGKAHIAYYSSSSLKYATNESGAWVISTIDPSAYADYISIAVDSDNKGHVGYYDSTAGTLKYATNSSGSWIISTVESTAFIGKFVSVAADSGGKAHIAYFDGVNKDLKYATNASGSWLKWTIDSTGSSAGQYSSLALDGNDRAHISYIVNISQVNNLKYITNASGAWVGSIADSAPGVGDESSIATGPDNKAHISYYDSTNKDLKYATNASGVWVLTTIDSQNEAGHNTSIAVDPAGFAHISYFETTSRILRYATNNPNTVDNDGDGYTELQGDCNDIDPIEHPGQTWYLDADNDGYSDGTTNTSSCARPAGYKAASELADVSGDCDDNNPVVTVMLWHPDFDNDGYGNPAVSLQQCLQPEGYLSDSADCDDNDINIYPGGPPVRTTGTTFSYYPVLQAAYYAAVSGETVQAQALGLTEDLFIDVSKSIVLDGGYDCGYSALAGKTIVNGIMTISNGTVTVGNFELR